MNVLSVGTSNARYVLPVRTSDARLGRTSCGFLKVPDSLGLSGKEADDFGLVELFGGLNISSVSINLASKVSILLLVWGSLQADIPRA